jgi:hypothetical protein
MTQSEYARHRGVKPPSVAEARKVRIKAAEVHRNGRTLIDSEIADLREAIAAVDPDLGGS